MMEQMGGKEGGGPDGAPGPEQIEQAVKMVEELLDSGAIGPEDYGSLKEMLTQQIGMPVEELLKRKGKGIEEALGSFEAQQARGASLQCVARRHADAAPHRGLPRHVHDLLHVPAREGHHQLPLREGRHLAALPRHVGARMLAARREWLRRAGARGDRALQSAVFSCTHAFYRRAFS